MDRTRTRARLQLQDVERHRAWVWGVSDNDLAFWIVRLGAGKLCCERNGCGQQAKVLQPSLNGPRFEAVVGRCRKHCDRNLPVWR